MTDHSKPGTPAHGSYERQDLTPSGVLYFLLTLGVITVICLFGLRGLYAFLDHYEKSGQPKVSPLVTNVPEDTRHVAPGYPQTTFPSPKLEEDERGQLNDIRLNEEKTLYSYGWVDQSTGTVHIPIERAMDLLVQRGLPVRQQTASADVAGATQASPKQASPMQESNKQESNKKDKKK